MPENFVGPVTITGDLDVQSGQVLIDRGNFGAGIGGESLIVKHSENDRHPGVTFMNDGGGHFVQRFLFGANSGLPNGGEAANLWADWNGLVIQAQSNLSFVVGSLDNIPARDAAFVFAGGDVHVNSNILVDGDIVLQNADCAEDFDVASEVAVEPGTVVAVDDRGHISATSLPYDRRAVGVISGAGSFEPAIVLDRRASASLRLPVALLGKVYCKVDADYGPIDVGDLLTTSPTAGHAMKAADPLRAIGAVLGKALRGIGSGRGMIPILVSLQ